MIMGLIYLFGNYIIILPYWYSKFRDSLFSMIYLFTTLFKFNHAKYGIKKIWINFNLCLIFIVGWTIFEYKPY